MLWKKKKRYKAQMIVLAGEKIPPKIGGVAEIALQNLI